MIEADWYATNARRAFPLDDAASGLDDAGRALPPGLLVDCSLRFPSDLGAYAFVSAASATPGLVTIAFEACDRPARPSSLAGPAPAAGFRPLGSIAVPAPFRVGEAIPIESEDGGVAGWAVLGPGCREPYAGTFSGPGQAGLLPRCARAYRRPPVASLRVGRALEGLAGRVAIASGSDVRVSTDLLAVDGVERLVLKVGLASEGAAPTREMLAAYAGPCGARPESRTCDPPAVESLGGATPDADGDVEVAFSDAFAGLYSLPLAGSRGGLVFDLPRTVADACPPAVDRRGAVAEEAAAGSSACDDAYTFPDPDWGLSVLEGVFAMVPAGCRAAVAPAAAAKARAAPPRRIRAVFRAASEGPGVAGGVIFDYTPGSPPSYRRAVLDLGASTLVVSRVVAGVATVEATAALSPAAPQLVYGGSAAEVVVSFLEATTPRTVSVVGSAVHGAATLTAELEPLGGGGFGLAAPFVGASFSSLEARDDVSSTAG